MSYIPGYFLVPLNTKCSRKCALPASLSDSSLEPVPTMARTVTLWRASLTSTTLNFPRWTTFGSNLMRSIVSQPSPPTTTTFPCHFHEGGNPYQCHCEPRRGGAWQSHLQSFPRRRESIPLPS